MNNKRLKKLLSALIVLFLFALVGCAAMPQVSPIEGEERDQVIADAAPIAENLFQGMNENNYAVFSRDFDDTMKKALDEKSFNEMKTMFDEKIGAFQSLEVEKVEQVDTLRVISYKARFEREEAVSVRLSLRQGETTQVAGLWFDSPKLREK